MLSFALFAICFSWRVIVSALMICPESGPFVNRSKNMRSALDDVIIFRWDGVRALALKDYASRKGFTLSAYLRLLLDKFVVSKGLLPSYPVPDNKSEG